MENKLDNLLIHMTDEQLRVLADAVDKYGNSNQFKMAIEEMSELTKALCKAMRTDASMEDFDSAMNNAVEEIADVQIMLTQLLLILKPTAIQDIVNFKIERLSERLHGEDKPGSKDSGNGSRQFSQIRKLSCPIEELGLSEWMRYSLRGRGIRTIGDLTSKSRKEILRMRGVGPVKVAELQKALAEIGLSLRDEKPKEDHEEYYAIPEAIFGHHELTDEEKEQYEDYFRKAFKKEERHE